MNRADLGWALSAVLPHTGKTTETAVVGLDYIDGWTYVYASDRYTTGIAKIPASLFISDHLPTREATDLMRFVRPAKVAEQVEEVEHVTQPGELHVAAGDDTAVFETVDSALQLEHMLSLIRAIDARPVEWEALVYQPDLFAKFAKAKRTETDRLRIFPRRAIDRNGVAVVTVGTAFVGAISGLTYDDSSTADTVSAFLNLNTKGRAA